jgi:hypothetical protein
MGKHARAKELQKEQAEEQARKKKATHGEEALM